MFWNHAFLGGLLCLLGLSQPVALLADWPDYRGNVQRTNFVQQPLTGGSWQAKWNMSTRIATAPAWPAPARGSLWQRLESIEARVTYDRAHIPLLVDDGEGRLLAIVTFSGHDCLLALDAETGQERWRYFAEAPIRFSPSVADGIAYFGADDGLVTALSLDSGQPVWQTRVGPDVPWIVGNQRLIAAHPIRTSVLISGQQLITHAGLFPSQGVYSVALDRQAGTLIWRRRLTQSPQGYLLGAATGRVIVPTGRSAPFMLAAENGSFLGELPSPGGSFCMLADEQFFTGPGNEPAVQSYAASEGRIQREKLLPFQGRLIAAGAGWIWSTDDSEVHCYRASQLEAGADAALAWKKPLADCTAMIASGTSDRLRLFLAVGNRVLEWDARTGEQLAELSPSRATAEDPILSLAISGHEGTDTLLSTTQSGLIECFQTRPESEQAPASLTDLAAGQPSPDPASGDPTTSPEDQPAPMASLEAAIARLPSDAGLALVSGPHSQELAEWLLQRTRLHIGLLCAERERCEPLRRYWMEQGLYGKRVVVYEQPGGELRFGERLFNLVVDTSPPSAAGNQSELEEYRRVLAGGGLLVSSADEPWYKPIPREYGSWTHQYAAPSNTADSGDELVGAATAFRLAWFGGVGPSRMPDRHLRGAAPLASGQTLIMHGDEILIGVDPANGTERWQHQLPSQTMRYGMPYDGGYSALTRDGQQLFTVVGREIWHLNAASGEILNRIALPRDAGDQRWGYLAEFRGDLLASSMRNTAPRLELDRSAARESYTNQDYNSQRPLVCSRGLFRLQPTGQVEWQYQAEGLIPHTSISVSDQENRIVLLEGLSEQCRQHATDRLPVADILQDGQLVCLDTETGQVVWQHALVWPEAKNILYSQIADDKLVLVTSSSDGGAAEYFIRVLELSDGQLLWSARHEHIRRGLTHGEQVHHPLALRQQDGSYLLVVEPYLYDLASGARRSPPTHDVAAQGDWTLVRPGHSCGTLSGAGNCLFFRANNPTVLRLDAPETDAFTALSPSRPSCWINMIPATGRLLIPEGSASCVCSYSLQTSMAFVPVTAASAEDGLRLLEDYPPLETETVRPIYGWNFTSEHLRERGDSQADEFSPTHGQVSLRARRAVQIDTDGLLFTEGQWLANRFEAPELPSLPRTISLEVWMKLHPGNPEWINFVGGLQDNGNYERGFALGMHQQRLYFAIASERRQRLSFLKSGNEVEADQWHHLVGTYDGTTMQLFVDGKLRAVSREQSGGVLLDPASWLTVGAYKDDNEEYPFSGQIRSVTIYQGALTARQIQANWEAGRP